MLLSGLYEPLPGSVKAYAKITNDYPQALTNFVDL